VNSFTKAAMVVCAVGIVAAVATSLRDDSAARNEPRPATAAPTLELPSHLPSGATSGPAPVPNRTDETPSPAFWIEELTAECDAGEGFAVTPLPLGADWRVTERGVYLNSPVVLTCVTGGANESLSYDWVADEGEIEGSGDRVVWTAPDHSTDVQVSVMVRDSSGAEELASLSFRVATCECVYQHYE